MIRNLAHGMLLSLLAAVAVDFGFGAAFISDVVAYLISVYVCLLLALMVGRGGPPHWSCRMIYRLPLAVGTALLVVTSLRSWALFDLPLSQYATTGHSPYVVLPVCALLLVLSLEGLRHLPLSRDASGAARDRDAESGSEAAELAD